MDWKVYIVKCSDKTFYTGITNNIKLRLDTHNAGNGAKYTKNRLPVILVYLESVDDKSNALKREMEIKKLNRSQKIDLINSVIEKHVKNYFEELGNKDVEFDVVDQWININSFLSSNTVHHDVDALGDRGERHAKELALVLLESFDGDALEEVGKLVIGDDLAVEDVDSRWRETKGKEAYVIISLCVANLVCSESKKQNEM